MVLGEVFFLRPQGRRDERDDSEVGYHRNLPAVSVVSALSVISALSKELISREAHRTFEAKLRNASTLLRLGITSKLVLLLP